MTDTKTDDPAQLPAILKSNMPAPTEIAAQFRQAFGDIYTKIEGEIKAAKVDLTTRVGREAVASLAYRISKTKTGLEKAANLLTEEQKAMVKVVVAERQTMSAKLDELRDKAREPLNKWQAAEDARVARLKVALEYLLDLGRFDAMLPPEDIEHGIADLMKAYAAETWAEYQEDAEAARDAAVAKFNADIIASQKRIAAEAEIAELRAMKAENERKAEEDRIEQERKAAADQAEQQRKADEAKAEAERKERDRVARETAEQEAADRVKAEQDRADEAEAKAKKAEADKIKAAQQAEADKMEAAITAEAEKNRAEALARQQERERLERIAADEKEAEETRAADIKHRKKINNAALQALIKCSEISEDQGKMILQAIAKQQVPHLTIKY